MAQVNQLVIQDMKDGVLVVDELGGIRQINRRAVEILGPLPKAGRELTLRDYTPQLADRLQRWREDPGAGSIPCARCCTHRLMGARFVPVGKSRSVGVVVFLEDLIAHPGRGAADEARCDGAAHGQHCARDSQPLSAINHAAELLLEESDINETQRRLLQIVHDNTQRLDRMVQDVLEAQSPRPGASRNLPAGRISTHLREPVLPDRESARRGGRVSGSISIRPITFDRSHLNQVDVESVPQRSALLPAQAREPAHLSTRWRAGEWSRIGRRR